MEELLECQSRLISSPDFHSDFRLGGQKSKWKQVTSKKLLAKWLTSLLQVQLPQWWEQSVSPFLQTLLLCRHTQRGKGLTTAHHTTHYTSPTYTFHSHCNAIGWYSSYHGNRNLGHMCILCGRKDLHLPSLLWDHNAGLCLQIEVFLASDMHLP